LAAAVVLLLVATLDMVEEVVTAVAVGQTTWQELQPAYGVVVVDRLTAVLTKVIVLVLDPVTVK
jgi:hypothetical protein